MSESFLVGLIGEGILESLSPDMHMTEAAEFGLDYEYRIVDLREQGATPPAVSSLVADAVTKGYAALNITHPVKQEIIGALDALSEDAGLIGAVNLVLIRDGVLRGENTDWTGFRKGLTLGLPNSSFATVLQYGAGGAGAATAYALLKHGVATLAISDLDMERAEGLADRYRAHFPGREIRAVGSGDASELLESVDGVVQATPVGMHLHPGLPFELERLAPSAWVADVVYRPIETELVVAARAGGHRVLDGGLMAVGQAADSLELITGIQPDFDRMRRHFLTLLQPNGLLSQIRGI